MMSAIWNFDWTRCRLAPKVPDCSVTRITDGFHRFFIGLFRIRLVMHLPEKAVSQKKPAPQTSPLDTETQVQEKFQSGSARLGNRADDWLALGDWLAVGEKFKSRPAIPKRC